MTGTEMTGITFFDLKDGKKIMHISQKGYNIPTPQNIEDYMLLHEKHIEEYKTKQKRYLSASQIIEELQHIRKMKELEKHK